MPEIVNEGQSGAALDTAHIGDIEGAFGTIRLGDEAPRAGLRARIMTLLAVVGPGLIVMTGDNDAGAFGTYAQAGQNYGTSLLWVLLLLVPVLYINQEMVLRLGVVAGVGHARLILERFGKFWGAFSVIDLFILNALTIVTEFIGISLGLDYLGLPKIAGVLIAAAIVVAAASTGSFRRFERVCLTLVIGSLLLVPILFMVHPTLGQVSRGLLIPSIPAGSDLSKVVLLIIGIVGTTVAPWQLFFQQSYLIDKRITPRFMNYERIDLWIGIVIVIVGATAIISFTAATFAGHSEFGAFTDAAGVASGLEKYVGKVAGILFAVALIDASIIGAAAVGLSTSYALGDVLGLKHSLHRKISDAKGFYAAFVGILVGSAIIVLIPGSPLGLLTTGVQVLAGVLLPSATVFLLLLCNDEEVLGPWVNSRGMNIFTAAIIAVLVILSLVLTAGVLYPNLDAKVILYILAGGAILALLAGAVILGYQHFYPHATTAKTIDKSLRLSWRMPPLALLAAPKLPLGSRIGLTVLRSYLLVAMIMVIFRIYQLAVGHK
ncbi:NRAMP family divalent metal transporter [Mesorhizobium sp.]|jgi:NRAMP (natural resistance-associated macrophage protein)-like metal ion transporter|uniref:NRAMP family divalent metal transporter n=1 Tax=Mesorhizobium sp. TaxID=1871066 RepID=UPI001A16FF30|nr:NRAMP family divalent metal transporter [Mesorhizobium sp.]HIQ17667.1 divalent metal cation transporter [Novosphingobium capsulatum]